MMYIIHVTQMLPFRSEHESKLIDTGPSFARAQGTLQLEKGIRAIHWSAVKLTALKLPTAISHTISSGHVTA